MGSLNWVAMVLGIMAGMVSVVALWVAVEAWRKAESAIILGQAKLDERDPLVLTEDQADLAEYRDRYGPLPHRYPGGTPPLS